MCSWLLIEARSQEPRIKNQEKNKSRILTLGPASKNMINWGIIGCGDVTEKKSGPAFSKVDGSSLVAVMRRNAEKAEDYAHRHNVGNWYSDADELMSNPDINAVYIATPPETVNPNLDYSLADSSEDLLSVYARTHIIASYKNFCS